MYMNPFDQLGEAHILCQYYGRYVDDSNMVDPDRMVCGTGAKVREFLADELGLQLHMGKLHIRDVRHGVEFLGASSSLIETM